MKPSAKILETLLSRLNDGRGILVVAVVGTVFLGIAIGLLVGKVIVDDPAARQAQMKSMSQEKTQEEPQMHPSNSVPGYSVGVRVDRSERALEDFVYEEDFEQAPEVVEKPSLNLEAETAKVVARPEAAARQTLGAERRGPGSVPVVGPKWLSEAVPTPGLDEEKRPLIAIVIDDVGIDQARSKRIINMDGPLTLAFIPYGYNLSQLVEKTKNNGHEVMLHMPMEPKGKAADPGPNALLTSLDADELRKRIAWDFDQFSGYVGINNHMGSKFTAWEPGMRLVMEAVRQRELLFLDSVTTSDSAGYRLAREYGVASVTRDVFIDNVQDVDSVLKQLKTVEKIAFEQGYAIAIGHPHDATAEALASWLPKVETRGLRLVPVSAVVRRANNIRVAEEAAQMPGQTQSH